jgi:hypothetical protein
MKEMGHWVNGTIDFFCEIYGVTNGKEHRQGNVIVRGWRCGSL